MPILKAKLLALVVRDGMPTMARLMTLTMLAAVSLVAIAEIDRLMAGTIGSDHQSHPMNSVIGPLAFTEQGAWVQWASSTLSAQVGLWVVAETLIDGCFVLAYVLLLRPLIARARIAPGAVNVSRRLLIGLVIAEIVEAFLLLNGAFLLIVLPTWTGALSALGILVAITATIKWLLVLLLFVAILRNPGTRTTLARIGMRAAQAVWVHRLSAVLVIALIVLACIPSDGVLDQLPDVQRQWLDEFPANLGYVAVAVIVLTVAAIASFAVGRQRTRASIDSRVRMRGESDKLPAIQQWWWWVVPVAVWLALATFTVARAVVDGRGWATAFSQINWPVAAAFLAVPALVFIASAFIPTGALHGRAAPEEDAERARYAWILGDCLALLVLCVGGLGLVRSFIGPVFLGPVTGTWFGAVALVVVGAATALLAPLLLLRLNLTPVLFAPDTAVWQRVARRLRAPVQGLAAHNDPIAERSAAAATTSRAWLFGILVAGILIVASMTLWPIPLAGGLGGVGVTVVLITAWGAILGSFTVALQDYRLLPVFRAVHLRATPVLSLAITVPLLFGTVAAAAWGGDPTLHAVRTSFAPTSAAPSSPAPSGPASDTVVQVGSEALLSTRIATSGCLATTASGTRFKPVLVIAAEGGGIRAASWTTQVLAQLTTNGGCLPEAVLLSSGVSGGSVGLALTHLSKSSTPADAASSPYSDIRALAGPTTVATAMAGLLAGDLVASNLGIHIPSFSTGDDSSRWRDRAALIEETWIDAVPELGRQYESGATDATGFIVLNSTDSQSKCRMIISQLTAAELATSPPVGTATPQSAAPAGETLDCSRPDSQPARSGNLAQIYGADCLGSLDWAAASMLSARFPIVTPAGRLPVADSGCTGSPTTQLIDGGYAEGSALGTVADLAPSISAAIRDYNATVTGADGAYAVPILVFVRNSAGFDLTKKAAQVTAEPLVPLVGYSATASQADQNAWIQRITASFDESCVVDSERAPSSGTAPSGSAPIEPVRPAHDCPTTQNNVETSIPSGVVVVAPFTRPTIVPPLGWALSEFSSTSLEKALENEVGSAACAANGEGYAHLCDLLKLAATPATP